MKIHVSHHEFTQSGIEYRGRHAAELIAPTEATEHENGRVSEGPPEEIWVRVGTEAVAISIQDLTEYLDGVRSRKPVFGSLKGGSRSASTKRTLH